jgi:diguanylate cyclase (GGDEF)-like protein
LINFCGASYAISNHIKRSNLLKLAVTDYQSGACNQLHLKTKLYQEVARSKVTNRTLSLLAVTIEDFTQILEIHGQTVGVELLKEFKEVTYKILRAGDEIFHDGNGTFYLLLPNCPIEGVTVLKERLTKSLNEYPWLEVGELQLNMGLATLNYNESADDFLHRASEHVVKQQQTALRLLAFND